MEYAKKITYVLFFVVAVYLGFVTRNFVKINSQKADRALTGYDPYAIALQDNPPRETQEIYVGKDKINAEIAQTSEEMKLGLMFRPVLREGSGMLFIYKSPQKAVFWMRNTLIPLDIIWFDKNLKAIHIEENVQPCSASFCPTYESNKPAMYVVEVNAGWVRANGFEVGDTLVIPKSF